LSFLKFLFEDSNLSIAAHPSIPMPQLPPTNKMKGGGDANMYEQESSERPREEHSRDAA
jgi:hypothetical protein